jgi:arylsulfatase
MFPAKGMFNIMRVRHLLWKERFPDRGQNRDYPFQNLENPRPEVVEASKPRFSAEDLPFNPREFLQNLPEWEHLDEGWGVGER